MRKISANYIYTAVGKPLKNGIITVDDGGKIVEITDTKGDLSEIGGLEFYNGVIVPGFINAHCHVELSHMKGILSCKKKGLPAFIDEIIAKRFSPEDLEEQIKKADDEMSTKGIVAVGDISNTDDSYRVKYKSKIHYHTFVEAFTVSNEASEEAFVNAVKNIRKLENLNLPGTLVPHASYSVPDVLFDKIRVYNKGEKKIISIHNQETESEDELHLSKSGALFNTLKKLCFNLETDFSFGEVNSIRYALKYFNLDDNILLIHNTYTKEEDISFAENFSENIYWVFCPNSNLYIEDNLPKLDMFFTKGLKICFGTDSYSSNDELSILSEMKTVSENFKNIPFNKIIESATINGAKALKIDDFAGSIEIGKTPGINLISNFDFDKMNLMDDSYVKVLV